MIEQDLLEGNKYFKWYWSICNRAKDRVLFPDIYVEKHHIYPKSIYGQNKDLVKLTAKEHYIVHLLLWFGLRFKYGVKDPNTQKMGAAFSAMNIKSSNYKNQRYNSKYFEMMKQACKDKKHTLETILKMKEKRKEQIFSQETREKISKANTGKKASDETREKLRYANGGERNGMYNKNHTDVTKEKISKKIKKNVYQYDLELNFIKKYDSIKQAFDETGILISSISSCCVGRNKTSCGFYWSHTEINDSDKQTIILSFKIKPQPNSKIIYQYKNDILINKFDSISEAARINNISLHSISNCARDVSKSAGGYIWKYEKIKENNV